MISDTVLLETSRRNSSSTTKSTLLSPSSPRATFAGTAAGRTTVERRHHSHRLALHRAHGGQEPPPSSCAFTGPGSAASGHQHHRAGLPSITELPALKDTFWVWQGIASAVTVFNTGFTKFGLTKMNPLSPTSREALFANSLCGRGTV